MHILHPQVNTVGGGDHPGVEGGGADRGDLAAGRVHQDAAILLTDRAPARYQEFIWSNRGLGLIGILIAWQLFSHVFDPVFLFTLNLLYPGAGYH